MEDIKVATKLFTMYGKAKERNIPCTLSFKRMKQLMLRKKCFYTGINMNNIEGDNNQKTFDRIDASEGYTDNNTVTCTLSINRKKSNLTREEITLIYNKIKDRN